MEDVLKKLNFSDKESIVYLALLKHGPRSLRALAEVTTLNRGTVYNALKSLGERGVVSFYHQNKHQHFIAERPEVLLRDAEQQEKQMTATIQQLKEALPELQSLYNDASSKPKVRYYEGMKGVRNILDDLLITLKQAKQKQYVVYSAADLRKFLFDCYPEFTDKRIKAGITVDVISTSPGGRLMGLDKRKWVDGDDLLNHTYILVYTDRTAYITQHQQEIVGVLIESATIADTQRFLFKSLWKHLPLTPKS